ncbi:hypothetical protein PHMEG_00022440 [Phytophthora megakarya]|uniref:Uncharacterized protein n=1 Tax=Phytophthora megakarya TaxID=4795 RepID=A0A225VKD0_9STRA|nr:hypothetical protein PHMEG_00022440 [Phytophthora megakarya]
MWIQQHPDCCSCDILKVAQVYCCVNSIRFYRHVVTKHDVAIMRLRTWWVYDAVIRRTWGSST